MKKGMNSRVGIIALLAVIAVVIGFFVVRRRSQSNCADGSCAGKPFVTVGGKVVATMADFKRAFDMANAQQPQLLPFLMQMPAEQRNAFLNNIAEQLALQFILSEAAESRGWRGDAEERKRAHDEFDRSLDAQAVQQKLIEQVRPADETAIQYYEANCRTNPALCQPQFKKELGGTKAESFMVNSRSEADRFAEFARKKGFAAAAQEAHKRVTQHGLVNEKTTGIDAALRRGILAVADVPAIVVIPVDGKFYVVNVTSRQEPVYKPFDEVRDMVLSHIMQKEFADALRQLITATKEARKIEIATEGLEEVLGLAAIDAAVAEMAEEAAPVEARQADARGGVQVAQAEHAQTQAA